jgi:hypothetical protein
MASGGKKKTTMAKLMRERKVLERRLDKQAKKNARKLAAAEGPIQQDDELTDGDEQSVGPDNGATEREPVAQALDA